MRACSTAHEQAQEQRLEGRLSVATEVLRACVPDSCPLEIRTECRALAEEIRRAQPSVILSARDENGAELAGVRVEVDGDATGFYLGGQSLELDPGAHHFRFTLPDGRDQLIEIELREGQKARQVVADFGAAEANGASRPLAWALGAAGVVALGMFTYFALRGNDQRGELRKCQPECTKAEVETMRERYLFADLSLGLSLLSFGGATYFFLQPSAASEAHQPEPERSAPLSGGLKGMTFGIGGCY